MKFITNQIVIIAGGSGTRMRPLIGDLPKCLVKINGKTLLERNIAKFAAQGFNHFHLLLGIAADMIIKELERSDAFLKVKEKISTQT